MKQGELSLEDQTPFRGYVKQHGRPLPSECRDQTQEDDCIRFGFLKCSEKRSGNDTRQNRNHVMPVSRTRLEMRGDAFSSHLFRVILIRPYPLLCTFAECQHNFVLCI